MHKNYLKLSAKFNKIWIVILILCFFAPFTFLCSCSFNRTYSLSSVDFNTSFIHNHRIYIYTDSPTSTSSRELQRSIINDKTIKNDVLNHVISVYPSLKNEIFENNFELKLDIPSYDDTFNLVTPINLSYDIIISYKNRKILNNLNKISANTYTLQALPKNFKINLNELTKSFAAIQLNSPFLVDNFDNQTIESISENISSNILNTYLNLSSGLDKTTIHKYIEDTVNSQLLAQLNQFDPNLNYQNIDFSLDDDTTQNFSSLLEFSLFDYINSKNHLIDINAKFKFDSNQFHCSNSDNFFNVGINNLIVLSDKFNLEELDDFLVYDKKVNYYISNQEFNDHSLDLNNLKKKIDKSLELPINNAIKSLPFLAELS